MSSPQRSYFPNKKNSKRGGYERTWLFIAEVFVDKNFTIFEFVLYERLSHEPSFQENGDRFSRFIAR